MTPEQLREAAEESGLEILEIDLHGNDHWHATDSDGNAWRRDNPALSPYIAELLMQEVPLTTYRRKLQDITRGREHFGTATAEQRITAAMRALTGNQEWGG